MYERILVPMDGSDNAALALQEAIRIAKKFDSELYIVSIARDQTYTKYGAEFGDDMMAHFEQAARKFLDGAINTAKDAGVKVKTEFRIGLPKPSIAETLPEELGTTLTVIGKSGVHGLSRAIMGSTTSYVVSHSHTNVLVVNEADFD